MSNRKTVQGELAATELMETPLITMVPVQPGGTQSIIRFVDAGGTELDTIRYISGTGVVISGDLTVKGTTTTVDSTVVTIADRILTLNSGGGPTLGVGDSGAGIEIDRGGADPAGWVFNDFMGGTVLFWGPSGTATQTLGNINEINFVGLEAGDAVLRIVNPEGGGGLQLPAGDSTQRDSSMILPGNGTIMFNTGSQEFQGYIGEWRNFATVAGGSNGFLPLEGGTMSGDIIFGLNGTDPSRSVYLPSMPGHPTLTFDGDLTTGLYSSGPGTVSIGSNGTAIGTWDSQGLSMNGYIADPNDPTAGNQVGDRDYNDERYLQRDGSNTITGTIVPDGTHDFGSPVSKFGTVYATTFDGTATSALYADVAERYAADMTLESGTVVVFGGEAEITQSSRGYDTRVAGVISTQPGYMLNAQAGGDNRDQTHPYLALTGRVPCKVVGKVEKGDLLTTSDTPGHAQVAVIDSLHKIGSVFAKALESKAGIKPGIIEVMITHS